MKPEDAKKNLEELRDSLDQMLGPGLPSEAASKDDAVEFRDSAREDQASFFEKMLQKAQKLPVVDTFTQLGVAGSVAVSSAAITQTDLAKSVTEVFVAEVANDVVEERIQPPAFMNDFVDFHELNTWGEIIIAEKFVEAQAYAGAVSEQIVSKIESGEIEVTKPENAPSAEVESAGPPESAKLDTPEKAESKIEQKAETSKPEDKQQESETKEPSAKASLTDKESDKQEQQKEPKTEDKTKPVEKSPASEETKSKPTDEVNKKVDEIQKVETPFMDDPIKPHDMVTVSPVN